MRKQIVSCQTCKAVVAYVYDQDERRKMRFAYGAPLATVVDGQVETKAISSQWFVIDIQDELEDTADSFIEVECDCADAGRPKKWTFALRATLDQLGTRRGIAL